MKFPTKYDPKLHGYEWLQPIESAKGGYHPGIDFNYKNDQGQDVVAIAYGIVKHAGECGSWGNHVLIYHPEYEVYSHYAHLDAICVKESDQVREGQFIGPLGNTGNSGGSHLHFEIRHKDFSPHAYVDKSMNIESIKEKYFNPEEWIKEKIFQEQGEEQANSNFDYELVERMKGKILLQIELHGEAWYVNPKDGKRYYMPDGTSAYNIMKNLGEGITNANIEKIPKGDSNLLLK